MLRGEATKMASSTKAKTGSSPDISVMAETIRLWQVVMEA